MGDSLIFQQIFIPRRGLVQRVDFSFFEHRNLAGNHILRVDFLRFFFGRNPQDITPGGSETGVDRFQNRLYGIADVFLTEQCVQAVVDRLFVHQQLRFSLFGAAGVFQILLQLFLNLLPFQHHFNKMSGRLQELECFLIQ